jgi:hypothetical protein
LYCANAGVASISRTVTVVAASRRLILVIDATPGIIAKSIASQAKVLQQITTYVYVTDRANRRMQIRPAGPAPTMQKQAENHEAGRLRIRADRLQ